MNIITCDFEFEPHAIIPENEVHLWRADLDSLRECEFRWQKILSSDESARACRFRFPVDRQRFVISRGLLRTILGSYLRADPGRLIFSYSGKDKPSLAQPYSESGVRFNVSHSGAVVLLAFTLGMDLGVDVEQIRSDFDVAAIARRFFSPHEQKQLSALPKERRFESFFRCWTRKEAYIKATGDGLSLPLHQFDVSTAVGDEDALLATRPDESEAGRWSLREVPAGESYVAALCVHGRGWNLKAWTGEQAFP